MTMLNKEDCENLDKLLTLAKSMDGGTQVDITYHSELGWRINVHPEILVVGEEYGDYTYKRDRLGNVCVQTIALLVQKKLGG